MTPSPITVASRYEYATKSMTDEQMLARFAELRDSHDPHDAEQAMRLADWLVERYMPLVGAKLRKWRAKMPGGLSMTGMDDLEATGMEGLWEALLCWSVDTEQSFVSFASTRIGWAMSAEVRRGDAVKDHARREILRSWRAVSSLENRLGREATEEEAAQASGVSVERYRQLLIWDRRSLSARLTEPLENYLSGSDKSDPLERLCAIEEALEALEEHDRDIRDAALEIGIAVENVKGYFGMEGAA